MMAQVESRRNNEHDHLGQLMLYVWHILAVTCTDYVSFNNAQLLLQTRLTRIRLESGTP